MRRRLIAHAAALGLAAVALLPTIASGDDGDSSSGAGGGTSSMSADALEKLVAPVALYPDTLLSNVLRASTVPIQIVEAARYLGQKSSGGDANESQTKNWDNSVQALLHYPKVVKQMSDQLDWTTQLGQVVISQQKDVMAAVQSDRARAAAQNALKSNDQVNVTTQPAPGDSGSVYYVIQPTDPDVVYVPTYPPAYLYPGHVAAGAGMAVAWGAGVATGAWLAGGFSWGHGDINVNQNVNVNHLNVNNANVNRANFNNTNVNSSRVNSSLVNSANASSVWHHPQSINQASRPGASGAASRQSGGIGSFGSPTGGGGFGLDGGGGFGLDGGQAAGRAGSVDGSRDGSFGGGFNGGSAGAHYGQAGDAGFGGHGGSAFSGFGGGGFQDSASDRGASSRSGGGFGGGGFGGDRGGGGRRR